MQTPTAPQRYGAFFGRLSGKHPLHRPCGLASPQPPLRSTGRAIPTASIATPCQVILGDPRGARRLGCERRKIRRRRCSGRCRMMCSVRVFKVVVRVGAERQGPTVALPNKPSIAVLPFQNLSADPEQEYFADSVVDDITIGAVTLSLAICHRKQFEFYVQRPGHRCETGRPRARGA